MPPITVPLHAPELAPGRWVQGPEVSIAFSRGAVVLVDFWESTCVNCLRTLPYLKAWHERYAGRGLVIVGVHTPEFEFTADPELVAAAARDEGIPYPVLLDQDRGTWQRFANHYWPARYLVDARGYLLAPEGYRPGEEVRHRDREEGPAPPGMFTARGLWRHEAEFLETREPGAELDLVCEASGVNLVLEPAGELEIEVDGGPVPAAERGADVVERDGRTFALWERPRMVRLVDSPVFRRRHLVLRFPPGVRAYAFSFSTCARPSPPDTPGAV